MPFIQLCVGESFNMGDILSYSNLKHMYIIMIHRQQGHFPVL